MLSHQKQTQVLLIFSSFSFKQIKDALLTLRDETAWDLFHLRTRIFRRGQKHLQQQQLQDIRRFLWQHINWKVEIFKKSLVNEHSRKGYKYLLMPKHFFQKEIFHFQRITCMFIVTPPRARNFPIDLSL